jgi:cytochrome b
LYRPAPGRFRRSPLAGNPAIWLNSAMVETRKTSVAGVDTRSALVWDLPLRLFHWLLVLALAGCWLTHELGVEYMDWHMRLGYLVLALLIFRLFWGFAGPRYARFSDFVRGPGAVIDYAASWLRGEAGITAGHNPLGGWSVLALLAIVALQAVSGLFNSDDILTSGPWRAAVPGDFADAMSWLHGFNFNVLLTLVALHIAAVFYYSLKLRAGLVTAMLTGRKRGARTAAGIGGHRLLAAAALAALAGGLVWLLIAMAPAPTAADFTF